MNAEQPTTIRPMPYIDGRTQPDEFLVHTLKATGSLMLIRVYLAVDGTLKAHWATGEYNLAEVDPMAVVELAHETTGCAPGRRVPPPAEAVNELADAWDAGYAAAQQYASERAEDRRVFERHGIGGTHMPSAPQNPHRRRPDWDF